MFAKDNSSAETIIDTLDVLNQSLFIEKYVKNLKCVKYLRNLIQCEVVMRDSFFPTSLGHVSSLFYLH